ncbi:hypothetical protein [Martelella mangrovi]|uniref:Uncharacterized protein n=1 Tax=Martelella mangrovi TaxID=1397477 RepID=A0ABV2IGL4_9HYPH
MATEDDPRFALIGGDPNRDFAMGAAELDFSTLSPETFRWEARDESIDAFAAAEMFSDFTLRWVGYERDKRDALEIRVYSARIIPDRVAVAADYGRMLGRIWSPVNFGVRTHDRDFGEVIGGGETSGQMQISRYVTFRRGEHLLVLRVLFAPETFADNAETIAGFIGSMVFSQPNVGDPIRKDMVSHTIAAGGNRRLLFRLPSAWQDPTGDMHEAGAKAGAQIYTDMSDPGRNLGIMIAWVEHGDTLPEGEALEQKAQILAENLVQISMMNLLPDQDFDTKAGRSWAYDALAEAAAWHKRFYFRVDLAGDGAKLGVSVLVTMGPEGDFITATSLSPWPDNIYNSATAMHGSFVDYVVQQDIADFWRRHTNKTGDAE